MNNNLQLVLKSSTTEMSLNDHDAGIYIVPELDGLTGLPEIRTTSGVNAGYDGGWTSAQKFDARSIVIRGVIANEDKTEVERMRRELVALLAQGKNEQLELDFVTETGRAYEVQVRTIACDMAMQRVLTQQEFMITLRADDPLIYDNSSAGEEATVNVSGATGGFRIPFEIPLAIDAGSEETVVQNSGLESVAPTIKMYGALHNPKIINHTTNQAMQVEAELGFTEGAWTTPVDAPEGTNVSFEPEREAPIESAKLKGDTYQQTYTGKNLLAFPYEGSGFGNGITFTPSSDGTVTLNGQNNGVGNSAYLFFKNTSSPRTFAAGTYYFIPPANSSVGFTMYTGSAWIDFNSGNNYTRTFSSSQSVQQIYVQVMKNDTTTFNNFKVYPMLSTLSGQTASDYEPYVGGVPAPNPDYPQAVQTVTGENILTISDGTNTQSYEVNLGKNLFNPAIAAHPSGMPNNLGETLRVDANTTYTFNVGNDRNFAQVQLFDNTGTRTRTLGNGASDHTLTFTTTSSEVSGLFCFYPGQAGVDPTTYDYTGVQLELGSTATSYAAYFTPIELCKIGDYQDYIYKDGDKWYVHKEVGKAELSSSWNWYYNSSSHGFSVSFVAGRNWGVYAGFCTHAEVQTSSATWTGVGKCGWNASNTFWFEDGGAVATSAAGFKTWLDSNVVNVYYALATPTDTEITNAALVAQLEALVDGDAVVYEGETNIAITAAVGNMPGIIAIRYYTDKEPDQRDELIVDSRLKTITLNGLDVYHLKTEGSEFPMLAPGENKLSLQSDITGDNGYAKVSYKQGYLSI